jgi:hypothetical protein
VSKRPSAPDPAELLARFRASYSTLRVQGAPPAEPQAPIARRPRLADLPTAVRRLLDDFREEHPDEQPLLIKHLRVVDGEPAVVVDDGTELPPEDELLTLSQTVTLNSGDRVQVVTDLFVARRR